MASLFSRKKDKDKDEMPVVAKKPPVPPKRNKLFSLGSSQNSREGPPPAEPTKPLPSSSVSSSQNLDDSTRSRASTNPGPQPLELNYGNGRDEETFAQRMQAFLQSSNAVNTDPLSPTQPHSSAVFGALKDFDLPGLKLPALQAVQVNQRRLQLKRGLAGDFGFTIRRVQFPFNGVLKTIVFAEPSEIKPGPPRPDDIKKGLLPGDQLVEIDGKRVDALNRDEINDVVRQAGDVISLTVRSVPELAEFCDRHRGPRDVGDSLLLTDVDTNAHENIPEDERYWLIHRGGYTVARLKEHLPDGRALVAVAGREMTVDPTDVDRANPSRLDRAPDLAQLRYLNETGAVHLLRQRGGSNLCYTNAGSASLICLATTQEPGVQERLLTLFKGCRRGQMPPHIYATAQQVYRYIQMTASPQAVLFTGVSGSGKSAQLRSFVQYLAAVAGWTKTLPYPKIADAFNILEAFGNASTTLHRDSTRFVQMFQLGFDKAAALRTAKIQCCLLESDRVVKRPEGESSFHVFYYLWAGADAELRQRLGLDSIESPMIGPIPGGEARQQYIEGWSRLLEAFQSLGFNRSQIDAICSLLGALFHLCRAEASPGPAQRSQFLRAAHARLAAALLGVSEAELATTIFRSSTGAAQSNTSSSLSRMSLLSRGPEGPEALAVFCAALYSELFGAVVDTINAALAVNMPCTSVTLIDIPGANFNAAWGEEGRRRASGLNDLVYNYVNERVAELFHDKAFAEMDQLYTREQVDVDVEKPLGSPHALNRLLDQKQHLVNCTDVDRRSDEMRGVFPIVEEESCYPGATDESIVDRIFIHLGDQSRFIRRATRQRQFVVAHGLDSQPTTYDVTGWVRQAQASDPSIGLRKLLYASNSATLRELLAPSGLSAGDSNLKLRRATQSVTSFDQAGLLRRREHGFAANLAHQIDYVFSVVRRSPRAHFVHCIQPSPNSGSSGQMLASGLSTQDPVDVPFVRGQMRSILLIDTVRANNRGYPERVSFRDFRRRFGCLTDDGQGAATIDDEMDDRAAVQKIMDRMDIHAHRYRLGISQVLLRSDVLSELEDRRDLGLSGLIVAFQREARRHLATKWLQKRRVLETAIRCIQKNGLSYMRVREWPWWRIYTRVLPLLPLNRVDDEHREWAERVRQLEHQLAVSKKEKCRLEGKCSEMDEALGREADAVVQLRGELEAERQQRMVVERRAADGDRLSRVSSVAHLEGEGREKEWKMKLEQTLEQLEMLKANTQRTVQQLAEVRAEHEETRARNETLEKKQARFDEELRTVQMTAEEQRVGKEKANRERDEAQQTLLRKRADSEALKSENQELRTSISRLKREIEEAQEKETSADAVELVQLRKGKREMETKLHDQEEELDDLAGQRQLLQQNVTRLEMQLERMKNDLSRNSQARDVETEELRAQYQRRVRAFEDQIVDLQDQNAALLKQNRSLEQRTRNFDAQSVSLELSGGHYKRELRKALALLADTQTVLAHERDNNGGQALIRQLRDQLEDAEATKLSALKGRHGLESELNELRAQIEQLLAGKSAAEEKVLALMREKNSTAAVLDDKDEQIQQLLKKYKAAVQQSHIDGIQIADYIEQIADLERAKQKLAEQLNERSSQLEFLEQHTVEKHKLILADQKIRELEAKLDVEMMMKQKLESDLHRSTDEAEALTEQMKEAYVARDREIEAAKKLRKELVAGQESLETMRKRDTEGHHRLKLQRDESEGLLEKLACAQAELKMANKRIDNLQAALAHNLGESDQELSDLDELDEDDDGVYENGKAHLDDSTSTNGMHIL